MRFATSADHRDFFVRNHYIEFDELLTEEEASNLKKAADEILARRLKTSSSQLDFKTPLEIFTAGRNLWREDPIVKKVSLKSQYGEIVANLFNKKILRIAYDQYFHYASGDPIFKPPYTLQEIGSFQKLVAALVIAVTDSKNESASEETPPFSPLPKKIGSGIFFTPELALSLDPLFRQKGQSYLMIAYCIEKTVYTLEKKDPLTHLLKKEGYVFGDLLKSTTHPIVYS